MTMPALLPAGVSPGRLSLKKRVEVLRRRCQQVLSSRSHSCLLPGQRTVAPIGRAAHRFAGVASSPGTISRPWTIQKAARSASAAMVSEGLTANAVGMIDPSTTNRFG